VVVANWNIRRWKSFKKNEDNKLAFFARLLADEQVRTPSKKLFQLKNFEAFCALISQLFTAFPVYFNSTGVPVKISSKLDEMN